MTRRWLSVFLLLMAVSTKAQQHRVGAWTELTVNRDLNKKWSATASVQMRKYPVAFNSQYIAEAGVARELGKRFKAGAGYRFTQLDAGREQRVQFDASYQIRFKGFQLADRARFQHEWNYKLETADFIRNKITLKYRKLKDLTPLLAAEAFYKANAGFGYVDQLRFFAGADYSFNKRLEMSLQWVRTQEIQVSNPTTTDVVYIGLTYDWQKAKKKKKKSEPQIPTD